MERKRILVAVKTYPTLSESYGELVCTAGIQEDGSWIRLYPVPFRRLNEEERYSKFHWTSWAVERNPSDPRRESHRPVPDEEIRVEKAVGTEDLWRERRRLFLAPGMVHRRIEPLIESARREDVSLTVFKPRSVLRFHWKAEERDWDRTKLETIRRGSPQPDMFLEEEWRKTFEALPKLPYGFYYQFEDEDGRRCDMKILDWEIGALFWRYARSEGDEVALNKVRQKYGVEFTNPRIDLHFFLGTTKENHYRAPNPWTIIGVFPIPLDLRGELFQ